MDSERDRRGQLADRLVLTLPSYGRWVSSIWNSETPWGRVSHRQVGILWRLRKREFMQGLAATPANLAELLSVRRSVITRSLAGLEAGGFISRESAPDDRRSQLIEITERGREVSIWLEEIFFREMMESIAFISDEEIEQLFAVLPLLNRLSANLESARKHRVELLGENPYEDVGL